MFLISDYIVMETINIMVWAVLKRKGLFLGSSQQIFVAKYQPTTSLQRHTVSDKKK